MYEIQFCHITPENVEYYYTRSLSYLERTLSRIYREKAEAGSTRSESGYQLVAASVCGRIARNLGLSEDKAKALSMAVGTYFPVCGHEGLKVVKQYIQEKQIDLDLDTLGVTVVAYVLTRSTGRIPPEIYNLIKGYFEGIDGCEELKIVRMVQNAIMDIKKAEHFYEGYPGDLLCNVLDEVADSGKSELLEQYRDKIKDYELPKLTDQEKQRIYEEIEECIEGMTSFKHEGELAKFNVTPEEAVLKYIYSWTFF